VEPNNETTIEELTNLLSKKCGYRNHSGFSCYHTWRYKNKKKLAFAVQGVSDDLEVPKYIYVDIWGKTDGRAGNENKYELPPPIDDLLFFGNIALVARMDKEHAINLTIDLWSKIYEKLFGGFEDLTATAIDDENESDELASIPASMKTSNGYLKDGFIVEDDSEDSPRAKSTSTSKSKSKSKSTKKKNISESSESEFVTETDTDSITLSSSDADAADAADAATGTNAAAEMISNNNVKKRTRGSASKPKRTIIKKQINTKKPVVEENNQHEEIESELSEESYD
jgi:hypothetical protein